MGSHADMSCLPLRERLESCYLKLILWKCLARALLLSKIAEDVRSYPKMGPRWRQDGSKMRPEGLLGVSWGALGASWGRPGVSWRPLGGLLGASWGLLGASAGVVLTKAKIGYLRLR